MNHTSFSTWLEDIGPIFLTEEQIQQRVNQLGIQISQDYAGKDLVVIGVLKGVLFFMADLVRAITIPTAFDFLAISRYGPTEQTHGVVRLTKDLNEPVAGRHALLVEDII
ncbi:MAG TPA: phosphoribosyltransferase family protein, partial [Candidatus Saccharimonadales bacterium]|nr:phosphoribosyltransferase family protein [Candidatus Saccharimonadales bacterium]